MIRNLMGRWKSLGEKGFEARCDRLCLRSQALDSPRLTHFDGRGESLTKRCFTAGRTSIEIEEGLRVIFGESRANGAPAAS